MAWVPGRVTIKHIHSLTIVLLAFAPAVGFTQQLALVESSPIAAVSSSSEMSTVVRPVPKRIATSPAWEPKFERWVDLKEMDFSLRYRGVSDSNGAHEISQGQQRSIVDGKFKFDPQGKYAIAFHGSTGKYFNWAYADFMGGGNERSLDLEVEKASPIQQQTIGQINYLDAANIPVSEASGGWSFYLRRLYLDLEPVRGVEVQYGSMDVNRGAASEITSYDNDGYITGERLLLKRPHNFFFDEASVTYAYLGDLYTPNFFERGERLKQSNYHQFLLRKQVKNRVDASFDYTWQDKANTFREAAVIKIPESRVIDSVRFESYQRLNAIRFREIAYYIDGGNGFAVTLNKKVGSRLLLDGGYADIDKGSIILTQVAISSMLGLGINGDPYGIGKRVFFHPTIKLTPYLEATGFYTREMSAPDNSLGIIWNKQALNAGLVFDMKKALFHGNHVK